MKQRLFLFLPALLLVVFAIVLGVGVYQAKQEDGQELLGKPLPEFYLSDLANPELQRTLADLPKKPVVLNVWASWCTYCRQEFPLLNELAKQGVALVGVDYVDQRQAALNTLETLGDPFLFSVQDNNEKLAMQLGGNRAPQTFLLDKHGVIRAYHLGLMRPSDWQQHFAPVLQKLNAE